MKEVKIKPEISIFLPVYNEEHNLKLLHKKISEVLDRLNRRAEIMLMTVLQMVP